MNLAIGFVLAAVIGGGCRMLNLPCPAPNALVGALLVLTITVGYVGMDYYLR